MSTVRAQRFTLLSSHRLVAMEMIYTVAVSLYLVFRDPGICFRYA